MSGAWRAVTRGVPGKWSVWRYHWLIHHPVITALERARAHAHGVLLDVGCGSKPFEHLFRGRVTRYLGTDLASSAYLDGVRPDVFARAEALGDDAGYLTEGLAGTRSVVFKGSVMNIELPQSVERDPASGDRRADGPIYTIEEIL